MLITMHFFSKDSNSMYEMLCCSPKVSMECQEQVTTPIPQEPMSELDKLDKLYSTISALVI